MQDNAFKPAPDGLAQAVSLLLEGGSLPAVPLPDRLPETGIGETDTLRMLAPSVVGAAATLGDETAFAHMDPPTPWVTWATTLWNAALNQNLLHPATSPTAKDIERRVIDWLKPHFGMDGGHMTPGATVANLTALWAARDVAGARRVFVSEHAHLSVWKSAHLLGLRYEGIAVDKHGRADRA
ncbi:MAG: aspartate aminotransferase family protein, partial [Pseudomonadota bacterium]